MESKVVENLKTLSDALILRSEIQLLSDSLYEASEQGFEHVLAVDVRSFISDAINDDLKKEKIDKKTYLKNLSDTLGKLRTVSLKLSFEPSKEGLDRIFFWIKENVGLGYLLDITYDKSIIGGVILEFNGKFKDFSLKKILEKDAVSEKEDAAKVQN